MDLIFLRRVMATWQLPSQDAFDLTKMRLVCEAFDAAWSILEGVGSDLADPAKSDASRSILAKRIIEKAHQGMVNVIERSPKAFAHMGEEDLRSQFLVQLNGQYHGRATGETFNYEGKTDILIREGDRNVFIAECKIWKGEADLLKAVDQILGYLHWRDTKAALLVFNRNKAFSEVLAKVPAAIRRHPNCKKLIRQVGETEWRFLFSSKDDSNRELQLAVLLFDVPRGAT